MKQKNISGTIIRIKKIEGDEKTVTRLDATFDDGEGNIKDIRFRDSFSILNLVQTKMCFHVSAVPFQEGFLASSLPFFGFAQNRDFFDSIRERFCKGYVSFLTPEIPTYPKAFDRLCLCSSIFQDSNSIHTFRGFFGNEMSRKSIEILLRWWYSEVLLRSLYLLGFTSEDLEKFGLQNMAYRIFKQTRKNPRNFYQISPERLSNLLIRLGVPWDPEQERTQMTVQAAAYWIWNRSQIGSHVGISYRHFSENFPDFEDDHEDSEDLFSILQEDYKVHFDGKLLLCDFEYQVQKKIADVLFQKIRENPKELEEDFVPTFFLESLVPEQQIAISKGLQCEVCVICGPPGTGKTSLLVEFEKQFALANLSLEILSFTGQAVNRIQEVIEKSFPRTIDNFIYCATELPDVIIFDEAGMNSNVLLYRLFLKCERLAEGEKLPRMIFIGDPNQLQPIEFGNFFAEILKIPEIPCFWLRENHRSEGALLLKNANRMLRKNFVFEEGPEFSYQEKQLEDLIPYLKRFLRKRKADLDQVVILTPYNKDLDYLNSQISENFNSGDEVTDSWKRTFRVGDRIRHTLNDATGEDSRNLFNGLEGKVIEVSEHSVLVEFRERSFYFSTSIPKAGSSDFRNSLHCGRLRVSFAKTVYSAQGSESDYVIYWFPYGRNLSSFLSKSQNYTAITRAKKEVVIFGNRALFDQSCHQETWHRNENLSFLLSRKLKKFKNKKGTKRNKNE